MKLQDIVEIIHLVKNKHQCTQYPCNPAPVHGAYAIYQKNAQDTQDKIMDIKGKG